ncbi:MAG: HD domain-containing protein [Defluviitaleaceae bacterium]|nr:HD domain-containing protein [Defluviitaleaceae bacterium]
MSKINPAIIEYVEAHIIPQYSQFDRAHNLGHVHKAIQNSLEIASEHAVDINMVYVIAAYHDIGLPQGRKEHNKHSAAYLLADEKLQDWFSQAEIKIMAEAVVDHRASLEYEPRSIYGKIISDADNDLEYMSVFTRCLQHGLAHFPHYDKDTHFERIVEHMHDKHGEDGYLKTWLNSEHDKRGLGEIRRKLTLDLDGMREDFERLWEMESF